MAKAQIRPIHAVMWSDRRHDRTAIQRRTTLRDEVGAAKDVVLEDLSISGFRMTSTDRLIPGQSIRIGLEGVGVRSAMVIWARDDLAGCQFMRPITAAEMDTTMNASVVIETDFTLGQPAERTADRPSEDPRLSARRRLAIILLAGTACWGVAIGIGLAIRALFLYLL